MEYAIAVIDIGMTNKKVAIYNNALEQIEAQYKVFPPIMVDGMETHDLLGMEDWFVAQLKEAGKKYPIKAIAVSTHGASFACIGNDGKACVPCVYYTYEPGLPFHDAFYKRFGERKTIQEITGTPELMCMINTAKGISFAQSHFPKEFAKTKHLLNYPQYWGYRLTEKAGAEGTYVGCHSYLWDWKKGQWSSIARELGVSALMPTNINNSWDVLGKLSTEMVERTGLSSDVVVTMGIHDSNSSLLPHFAKKGETGFILNSTGTWCVIMNPVKKYGFSKDELGKVVFFNQSAFRTPVKTAIFLGGQEFETWSKILMAKHGRTDFPPYKSELYDAILEKNTAFLMPELTAGSGQFPGSKPRVNEAGIDYAYEDIKAAKSTPPCFSDYETGIAVLRISLVMQTLVALERVGIEDGKEVFTEGGFRKNEAYNALLSTALPLNRVALTDIAEATALGAAMTAKMALTGKKLAELAADFEVEYKEVPKRAIPALEKYRQTWLTLLGQA